MIVHPEETRLPGHHRRRQGRDPARACTATRPARRRSATCSRGSSTTWSWTPDSYGELEEAAAKIAPGETGLVALDWWNGNRTILADADLTGAIFGLGLHTTREQIYRALLESIAFGSRRIMDNFEEHGLVLSQIVACGGIAERSPLMMQLLADTSGREVHVPEVNEIPARGAALFGGGRGRRVRGHRRAPSRRPAPRRCARTSRTSRPRRPTTACTRSTARLYEYARARRGAAAARPEADPHRKERRVSRQPRIGLLGIMQELYDDMIPGITERQGRVRGRGRASGWPASPTSSSRGRRATARTSRRSPASWWPRTSTGSRS